MALLRKKYFLFLAAVFFFSVASLYAQDTATPPADSTSASPPPSAVQAQDSTAAAAVSADSTASPEDTATVSIDSLVLISADKPQPKGNKPRPSGTEIEALVVPWDWDDYTNVIEVGLRRLEDSREYSLEKNEEYRRLFDKFKDQEVRVWGSIKREEGKFYSMTINAFELRDTTAAKQGAAKDSTVEIMPTIKNKPPLPEPPPSLAGTMVDTTMKIQLFISDKGVVDPGKVSIIASSGYPELDTLALEWGKGLEFSPAVNKGDSVGAEVAVPVIWRIKQQLQQ